MKIIFNCEALVLAKTSNSGKDGNIYHKLQLFLPDSKEAGSLGCSSDVFNSIKEGSYYILSCEYNTDYKSLFIKSAGESLNE